MKTARMVLALALVMLIASPLMAKKPKKEAPGPAAVQIDRITKSLTLTDDQKAKLEDLKKEYNPKLADAAKKIDDVLTDDQKKAAKDAEKAAKDAGKKGKEVHQAGEGAVMATLTEDQKTKRIDARKDAKNLEKELRIKVLDVLTADQQDQVKKTSKKSK